MTRGRWAISALVVVLLVGALGAYFLLRPGQEPTPCEAVEDARDELLDRPFEGGGSRDVLVIGDSYSQGTGAGGPGGGWPATLAELSGATVTVDGMGATGYTTAGFCAGEPFTYADRLADRDVADDTTVVVQGSVNDGLDGDPADVQASAEATLDEAEGAELVVVVGPPSIPTLDAAVLGTIDQGLAAAAQADGAVYVSLLTAGIPIGQDGVHPTAEGQVQIAQLVAAALG